MKTENKAVLISMMTDVVTIVNITIMLTTKVIDMKNVQLTV